MNETKEEASNNVSMKSLNCDVSMNGVDEVDLTDLSMKETTDDELDEEKVEKLKLFAEKLLYSEDEAEQIELALKLRKQRGWRR